MEESAGDYDGDVVGVPPVVLSGNRRCLSTLGARAKEGLNPFQISEMFKLDFSERSTGICTLTGGQNIS